MPCFCFPDSVVIILPLFCDSHPSFLTSLHPIFTPLLLKIECFSCKNDSPQEYPFGTKTRLKMVGNTPKMMFRAPKFCQKKAKNTHL